MQLDLTNRVYLIVDESVVLGRAAAECLAAEGARVVLAGKGEESLQAAATDLGESAAAIVVTDGVDEDTPERLVAAALERWGRVDGALICVGDLPEGRASEVTDEEWTTAFESVFLTTVRLCRHIAGTLSRGGSLAVVLSTSSHEPVAGHALANGLQSGLASVALQLAEELGPRGVRVNGLLPGNVATSPTARSLGTPGDALPVAADRIDASPKHPPGSPEEFGRVATFILSPAASYISGTMISIDGGMQSLL